MKQTRNWAQMNDPAHNYQFSPCWTEPEKPRRQKRSNPRRSRILVWRAEDEQRPPANAKEFKDAA